MYINSHRTTSKPFMDKEDLMKAAPSIFTEAGSENTSSRYAHISTYQVIEGLRKEGFVQ